MTEREKFIELNIPWFTPRDDIIRVGKITTIGDGSCFIHSTFKAMYEKYQNNSDLDYRKNLAYRFRHHMAANLQKDTTIRASKILKEKREKYKYLQGSHIDNDHKYAIIYETFKPDKDGIGIFISNYIAHLPTDNASKLDYKIVDYSLKGLQNLFNNPTKFLGDESIGYVSKLSRVNIIIIDDTTGCIRFTYPPDSWESDNDYIVIIGNGIHYEVVVMDTPKGYLTTYEKDHPFLLAMRKELKRALTVRQIMIK